MCLYVIFSFRQIASGFSLPAQILGYLKALTCFFHTEPSNRKILNFVILFQHSFVIRSGFSKYHQLSPLQYKVFIHLTSNFGNTENREWKKKKKHTHIMWWWSALLPSFVYRNELNWSEARITQNCGNDKNLIRITAVGSSNESCLLRFFRSENYVGVKYFLRNARIIRTEIGFDRTKKATNITLTDLTESQTTDMRVMWAKFNGNKRKKKKIDAVMVFIDWWNNNHFFRQRFAMTIGWRKIWVLNIYFVIKSR